MSNSYGPPRGTFSGATKWLIWLIALIVVAGALIFVARWVLKPTQIFDPTAIENRSKEANDSYQALKAMLANIETPEKEAETLVKAHGEEMTKWPQGEKEKWLQLQTTIQNRVAAYNTKCATYNAMWQDEWRAIQAPPDLPRSCELR